jgi:hypothetical protein
MNFTNEQIRNMGGHDFFDESFNDDFSLKDLRDKTKQAAKAVGKGIKKVAQTTKLILLVPFLPVMVAALKAKGLKASMNPKHIKATTEMFYNNIVRKSSGFESYEEINFEDFDEFEQDNLADEVVGAVFDYVKKQVQYLKEGKKLSKVNEKLAKLGIKGEQKAIATAQTEVNKTVGQKVMSFSPWIIGGVVLTIIVITYLASRK